jgi:hypothetical protein
MMKRAGIVAGPKGKYTDAVNPTAVDFQRNVADFAPGQ